MYEKSVRLFMTSGDAGIERAVCSASASNSEERITRTRKRTASSSELPKCGSETTVSEMISVSEKPSKEFHRLTIAELKTILTEAGVKYDRLKRKSEFFAAVESVAQKEKDTNGVIDIPSDDDDQGMRAASSSTKPLIVLVSSSDDEEAPVLTMSQSAPVAPQRALISASASYNIQLIQSVTANHRPSIL
jgi:hypothetical protein